MTLGIRARVLLGSWLFIALVNPAASHAGRAPESEAGRAGEALYLKGVLSSGAPLLAARQGNLDLKGPDAACVSCHRRSGLGSAEGSITVPPITARYLFHERDEMSSSEHALTYVENAHGNRSAYTRDSLARALRAGIDADGRALSPLMPRFDLADADVDALIAYLRSLERERVPGVTDTLLHFATIITPDADPARRQGLLDVLQQYVSDKNAFPFGPSPRMRTSSGTLYSKSMYVANRRWQLHVWELSGPEDSWRAQLDRLFEREPVMAVISGLGGSRWAPVHDFCEQRRVPCLFPNVEVPVVKDDDFYSVYLSKGVLLEAELIEHSLSERAGEERIRSVVQVYRAGDSGEAAARALRAALGHRGVSVHDHPLPAGEGGDLARAFRGGAGEALVLWLRPRDLAALGAPPPAPVPVYLSGLLGGLEKAPLPPSWRERTRIAYPVDLPDRRVVRVDYPLGWFRLRHVAVVDERMQADTYLACGILSETLKHMADTIVPDYLVEQLQAILDHRILTGYYPRLTLAVGQTLGSKGGYVVRFAGVTGSQVVPDGEWVVP